MIWRPVITMRRRHLLTSWHQMMTSKHRSCTRGHLKMWRKAKTNKSTWTGLHHMLWLYTVLRWFRSRWTDPGVKDDTGLEYCRLKPSWSMSTQGFSSFCLFLCVQIVLAQRESTWPTPPGFGENPTLQISVAVGIGLGLGIPLLILIIYLIWRKRRTGRRARGDRVNSVAMPSNPSKSDSPASFAIIPNKQIQSLEVIGKGFFGEVKRGNWQGITGTIETSRVLCPLGFPLIFN